MKYARATSFTMCFLHRPPFGHPVTAEVERSLNMPMGEVAVYKRESSQLGNKPAPVPRVELVLFVGANSPSSYR